MATDSISRRIGITMRVVQAQGYNEQRDALAADWAAFMRFALPQAQWVPVPNLGEAVVDFARDWQLDGLILSGGNDIGENPQRDTTERSLLAYFLAARRPVFGVCRGLQLLQTHFGGTLSECDAAVHIGVQHPVTVREDPSGGDWCGRRQVNSFHRLGIRGQALCPPLRALATSDDGWVEAAGVPGAPVLALMWHPERDARYSHKDRAMLQWLFGHAAHGAKAEAVA